MSAPSARYRVSLSTWQTLQIEIEAADEDAALEAAEALYEQDTDAFTVLSGGFDDWQIEPA